MKQTILVTDSLFIKERHVRVLSNAGFAVERLDKPAATEEELIKALTGKVGYILGGIEKVTDKIIDASDQLKAIVFTGTSWNSFIPGHKRATEMGIAIGAAPHLNAHAVAEWGLAMSLLLTRDMINLARGGKNTFETTMSLSELTIGIVGPGHIGEEYLKMIKGLGVKNILYANRTRKADLEGVYKISYVEKSDLFRRADLVFVALSVDPGDKYISAGDINAMKRGAMLVTSSDPLLFDLDSLYGRLKKNQIRAAFDENIEEDRFHQLPLGTWFTPNASSAFNTGQTIEDVSASCVETMINILTTGKDRYKVN